MSRLIGLFFLCSFFFFDFILLPVSFFAFPTGVTAFTREAVCLPPELDPKSFIETTSLSQIHTTNIIAKTLPVFNIKSVK